MTHRLDCETRSATRSDRASATRWAIAITVGAVIWLVAAGAVTNAAFRRPSTGEAIRSWVAVVTIPTLLAAKSIRWILLLGRRAGR